MDKEMKALVSRFAEYLRRSEQQLQCFHKYESQVEGWFKGELICFLDQEKLAGRLAGFERERESNVGDKNMKVDIALQFDKLGISWVELKHWHIGKQKGRPCRCGQYCRNNSHDCYVKPVVDRLMAIHENGDKFMLVLLTKNPGSKEWNSGVEKFNNKFSPLSVRSLTNPGDYPDHFFLGLLHVGS